MLCARTYLAPGRAAAISPPTYAPLPDRGAARGRRGGRPSRRGATLDLGLQPEQPDRRACASPARSAELARAHPDAAVVVDEAYFEYAGATCVAADRRAAEPDRAAHALEGVRLRVRCGSATRSRPPRRGGAARAAPGAGEHLAAPRPRSRRPRSRDPRLRRRGRPWRSASASARRSLAAGLRLPRVRAATSSSCARDEPLGERLEAQGLVVRSFPRGSGSPFGARPRTTSCCAALGAASRPAARARARSSLRTTTETALRLSLDLDGGGPRARRDRDRLPRPPADALRLPRRASTSSCSRAATSRSTSTTPSRTSRGARRRARGRRSATREGVARYGSAIVPMDEALATAAVDLVRRPHAEVELAFAGERVGGARAVAALARARAARDAGRLSRCTSTRPAPTTTTSPRPRSRRSGRRCGRPCAARRRRASARRRGWREGRRSPTTAPATCAASAAALVRAGAEPVVTTDPAEVREAPLAVIAGVGHVESAAPRARAAGRRRLRERAAAGRPVARHLRRPAAPLRRERGRRGRARPAAPARCGGCERSAFRTWAGTRSRSTRAIAAPRRARRAPTSTSRTATRPSPPDDGRRRDGRARRARRRRRRVRRRRGRPVPPRAERRRRRARARERAAMVKKRVIPCLDVAGGRVVKGVRFQSSCAMSATRSSSRRATPSSAPTSSSSSTSPRRSRSAARRSSSSSAAAEPLAIPFTVGGGVSGLRGRAGAASRRRRQGRGQPRRRRRAGADHRARRRVRLAGGRLRDRRARGRGGHARRHARRAAATRSTGRARRRSAARARSSLTSIDADGTRAGYDLELTRAVADAVDVPVIASGGAGEARAPRRGARRRRQAALLASIVHERPERLPELKRRAEGGGMARPDLTAGDRAGRRHRPRADARVDGRRGAAADARDRRGVVLEPLAAAALAQGRDLGQHARGRGDARRLRRRRAPPARAPAGPDLPHRRRVVLRALALAPDQEREPSGPTARTSSRLLDDAGARRAQGGRGRARGGARRRRARPTSGWSRRSPTSSSTATCCSPRAGSTLEAGRGRAARRDRG